MNLYIVSTKPELLAEMDACKVAILSGQELILSCKVKTS